MYISMYLLKTKVKPAELSARLSTLKVPLSGSSVMARKSLPSLEPLPDMTPPSSNILHAAPPVGVKTPGSSGHCHTPSTAVHPDTATMLPSTSSSNLTSSCQSSTGTPQTVEVILVSGEDIHSNGAIPSQDNLHFVKPLTVPQPEYKLSEIVGQKKEQLFQQSTESVSSQDYELVPPREGVYNVRRRSRQFFTVQEEEESSDNDTLPFQSYKESDVDGGTVLVDPVFNLGESLRRLYFPNDYRQKKSKLKRGGSKKLEKENEESRMEAATSDSAQDTSGYESDPLGCVTLFEKVSSLYSMRRVQSQPEMEEMQELARNVDTTLDYSTFGLSKSLPNTPRVSPKLLRKVKTGSNEKLNEKPLPDVTGPGFSFLASVAGNVRLHKAKQEKQRQEELHKRQEKSALAPALVSDAQLVNRNNNVQTLATTSDSKPVATNTGTTTNKTITNSDINSHPFPSKDSISSKDGPSFVKNIVSWGTKKRVTVSSKESNMFSPTSF